MKVIYLLLGLGCPTKSYINKKNEFTSKRMKQLAFEDFIIDSVSLNKKDNMNQVLYLKFIDENRNDAKAQRIADAICAGITLIHSPVFDEGLIAFPILESAIHNGLVCKKDIIDSNDELPWEERISIFELERRIDCILVLPYESMKVVFDILPTTLSHDLFEALHFYQESVLQVYFGPGVTGDVLSNPQMIPQSAVMRKKYENALQNAFKAIEAIVGDPPKDDERLKKKLVDCSLNPDEEMGFHDKETLFIKIRNMSLARDKKAAHGRSASDRKITNFEIMDFQNCVLYSLDRVIQERIKKETSA